MALGLGSTRALSGLVGGALGETIGGPITGIGNGIVFGDSYGAGDFAKGILWGGVFGAGLGALDAAARGLNPITGNVRPGGNAPRLATANSGLDGTSQGTYNGPDYMWSGDDLGSIYKGGDPAGPQVVVRASGSGGSGNLNDAVLKNFNRFVKKIPANSKSSASYKQLNDGNYLFEATSMGRVPGSKAVYQKWVNPYGETFKMLKTTFAPDGSIIHIKVLFILSRNNYERKKKCIK